VLESLISEVLRERGVSNTDLRLSINPELAPIDLVFEQALTIESLSPAERENLEARYEESKVVLIRSMISDQLRYVNIAKEWFTIADLAEIRRRKIGSGKIGGKSAGMLLAQHILKNDASLGLPIIEIPNPTSLVQMNFTTSWLSITCSCGMIKNTRRKRRCGRSIQKSWNNS